MINHVIGNVGFQDSLTNGIWVQSQNINISEIISSNCPEPGKSKKVFHLEASALKSFDKLHHQQKIELKFLEFRIRI